MKVKQVRETLEALIQEQGLQEIAPALEATLESVSDFPAEAGMDLKDLLRVMLTDVQDFKNQ